MQKDARAIREIGKTKIAEELLEKTMPEVNATQSSSLFGLHFLCS
jgi:hypothetical protein